MVSTGCIWIICNDNSGPFLIFYIRFEYVSERVAVSNTSDEIYTFKCTEIYLNYFTSGIHVSQLLI